MDPKEILDNICRFADKAHGGQMRKYTPERYIVHPIRVMEVCNGYTDQIEILAAALLHDVLEDTTVTATEIEDFLKLLLSPKEASFTVKLVIELSDVYVKTDYPKLNRKQRKAKEFDRIVKTGAQAQTIKYADILDNCKEIVKHDRQFAPVFLKECLYILNGIDKGDKELRQRALTTVTDELKKLKR